MALNKSDIESGLKKKGFFITNTDHECFIYKTCDGATTTVRTKLSFGSKKDVDEGLIHLMAKQCQLNKKEFQDLVTCSLGQVEYEDILKSKGFIE